jgi:hypothetical protein
MTLLEVSTSNVQKEKSSKRRVSRPDNQLVQKTRHSFFTDEILYMFLKRMAIINSYIVCGYTSLVLPGEEL